jgi:magnesium-protoporphyrin IX monomethyl ester (oxidative) cyclase
VQVIDAVAEGISKEGLKNAIAEIKPDVIGVTSFINNGGIIYDLGKWIKNEYPHIIVVFGNIHAAVYAEGYLRGKCCDIVVHGEGEYTFLKILDILEKKQNDFSSVPSISYLKNGSLINTCGSGIIEDLSKLPLPDRDAVDQKLYNIPSISNIPYFGKKNSIAKHMFTARGCPFKCQFCVVHNKGGQRFNSTNNVLEEIEVLIKRYSANYIFFMDSLFISNKQRVIDICRGIKKGRLYFKWGCEGHVNFVDQELVEEMESAGCNSIAFGIESGVQRLLNMVKKGITLERTESAVTTVKKYTKIKVSGLFILGLPSENYRDSLQTINFAKKLPLDMAQFSICVPYPGSPLFYELKEKNEIDTGIREDGKLDTSVWLRYSTYISYTPNEAIWVTPELTSGLLKKLLKKALRDFYFRPKQLYLQLKRLHPFQLWKITQTFFKTFF